MNRELERLGIVKAVKSTRPRHLVYGVHGLEKEGKTTFGFGMPDPLAVITNDPMTESIVQKEVEKGRDIDLREFPDVESQATAKPVWEEYQKVYSYMLKNYRSLIVDTDTGAWVLQRMAEYGKLSQVPPNAYVTANARKGKLIREAKDSDCNVCFVYKVKKVYVKTAKDKMGSWNGEWERDGFNQSGFLLQANLRAFKELPEEGLAVEERFKVEVINCTFNAELDGEVLEYPLNNFSALACAVFPMSEPEEWE